MKIERDLIESSVYALLENLFREQLNAVEWDEGEGK